MKFLVSMVLVLGLLLLVVGCDTTKRLTAQERVEYWEAYVCCQEQMIIQCEIELQQYREEQRARPWIIRSENELALCKRNLLKYQSKLEQAILEVEKDG